LAEPVLSVFDQKLSTLEKTVHLGVAGNAGNAGLPDEASGVSNDGRSRVAPVTREK